MEFQHIVTIKVDIPEEKLNYCTEALIEARNNGGELTTPLQIGKTPHIYCLGIAPGRDDKYRARTVAHELIKEYGGYGEKKKWPVQFTTTVQKELLKRLKERTEK